MIRNQIAIKIYFLYLIIPLCHWPTEHTFSNRSMGPLTYHSHLNVFFSNKSHKIISPDEVKDGIQQMVKANTIDPTAFATDTSSKWFLALGILACSIQTWSYGHVVLFDGSKHYPVTHQYNDIWDHEGAIKPSVEQVNSSWTHHPPPAQQVAWAEEALHWFCTNSSAVSLQGFSKEAPSGAGMDFLIEHKGWLWDPV